MKHSLSVKFAAIFLAALSLVSVISGITGIVAIENAGLYVSGLESLQRQEYESMARDIAEAYADLYAVEKLGSLPYKLKQSLFPDPNDRGDSDYWTVMLREGQTVLVDPGPLVGYSTQITLVCHPLYPIAADRNETPPETTTPTVEPSVPETESATVPRDLKPANIPDGYLYRETETFWENGGIASLELYYYEAPEYTVTVYMKEAILDSSAMHMLTLLYPHRYTCIGILAGGIVAFAVCFVFLLWAAGRNSRGEVNPGGLNRLPLDLYACFVGLGCAGLSYLFSGLTRWVRNEGPHPGNLSLLAVTLLGITLLVIGLCFALAAQVKLKNGYWWRHTLLGRCLCRLSYGLGLAFRGLRAVVRMLPLIWRWLLTALVMAVTLVAAVALLASGKTGAVALIFLAAAVCFCVGVVCYGAHAYGVLMRGIHRMTDGDLSCQVPTKYLVGGYLDLASQLNSLSETAMISAREQTKSERMRTELITNVSHDIKTPLTSIINFVDLLRKPHSPAEEAEYLEVLSRQSERMKKLIEDLMELSRASSGYITVDAEGFISLTDAGRAVAEKIYERHTVLSQMLIRLGVSPETAAEDACRMEHAISDESFAAIKKHIEAELSHE